MGEPVVRLSSDRPLTKPGALQAVLEALDKGESAAAIAKGLGISDVALYRFLIRNAPDDWKAISSGKALAKIDQEDKAMDKARNGIMLGRARERMNQARWTLERAARSIYGDKLQIEHSVSLETGELLGAASELLSHLKRRKERVVNEPQTALLDDKHSIKSPK